MEDLTKLTLKKLNQMFEIAIYGEHYAIDGANYERAQQHSTNAYKIAEEICRRKEANKLKRAVKH